MYIFTTTLPRGRRSVRKKRDAGRRRRRKGGESKENVGQERMNSTTNGLVSTFVVDAEEGLHESAVANHFLEHHPTQLVEVEVNSVIL
jgi:hypothetical protein